MAAGHPRLSFELDTFTYLQPAHFRIDTDYRERKRAADSANVWAAGQAESVGAFVNVLAGPDTARAALWPEFSLFDCFGCHHAIGALPPVAAADTLGLPRLGSPSFLLYRELTAEVAPGVHFVSWLVGHSAAGHAADDFDGTRWRFRRSGGSNLVWHIESHILLKFVQE